MQPIRKGCSASKGKTIAWIYTSRVHRSYPETHHSWKEDLLLESAIHTKLEGENCTEDFCGPILANKISSESMHRLPKSFRKKIILCKVLTIWKRVKVKFFRMLGRKLQEFAILSTERKLNQVFALTTHSSFYLCLIYCSVFEFPGMG